MKHLQTLAYTAALASCSASALPGPTPDALATPAWSPPAEPAKAQGRLELQISDERLHGTYALGGRELAFVAAQLATTPTVNAETPKGLADIEVALNGMLLCASVDGVQKIAELDGFATSDGEDTAMTPADRRLLTSFRAELLPRLNAHPLRKTLARTLGHWAQTPDTAPLQRAVLGGFGASSISLCDAYGRYEQASHDDPFECTDGEASGDQCVSLAQLGARYAHTYYFVDGAWTQSVPDHGALLFETGECFGNCGWGCPSGAQTLTLDCLNHDQCVRNGHSQFSLFCLDEFLAAADDEFFGLTCEGT